MRTCGSTWATARSASRWRSPQAAYWRTSRRAAPRPSRSKASRSTETKGDDNGTRFLPRARLALLLARVVGARIKRRPLQPQGAVVPEQRHEEAGGRGAQPRPYPAHDRRRRLLVVGIARDPRVPRRALYRGTETLSRRRARSRAYPAPHPRDRRPP